MPTLEVTDPRGRTLELEGDHEPTASELADIFDKAFPEPTLHAAVPAPAGMAGLQAEKFKDTSGPEVPRKPVEMPSSLSLGQPPTELERVQQLPPMTAAEAEQAAFAPYVKIPRVGQPGTITRGLSETAAGAVESLESPGGAALMASTLVPGLRTAVAATLAASMAKGGAEQLGEATVTKNLQTTTEGLAKIAMAGLTGAGAAVELMPKTAAASDAVKPTPPPEPPKAEPTPTVHEVNLADPIIEGEIKPAPPSTEQAPETQAPTEPKVSQAEVPPAVAAAVEPAPAITETTTPVREAQPTIVAGKLLSDGSLIVAREHRAFGQEESSGESVYVVVPSSVDPMLFEHDSIRLEPSDIKELGIIPVTITEAEFTKGDIIAAANSKAQPSGGTEVQPKAAETTTPTPAAQVEPAGGTSEGPGAASPGDIPKESQLQQLTEAIKTTKPTPATLKTRLANEARAIKEQVQTKWERTLDTMRSTGEQVMANLRGVHEWTDFKDALGKFSGAINRNDKYLQDFTHEITRVVPDKLRREAIVNWIQADGDSALLATRAAASSPRWRPGYEMAQKLTPDEMVLADNMRSYLDAKLQEGIDSGLLTSGIQNYINQVWDRPNPVTQRLLGMATTGKLQPNFKYARQRIFESYFEGEQAGYKPKLKDVGALIAAYDQAFSRALASRNWLKAMHEGKAKDGRPLVEVSGVSNPVMDGGDASALLIKPKVKPHETGDYLPVSHPAMQGWRWAGVDENGKPILYQGDLLVHPEVWKHVRNVLGRSALRDIGATKVLLDVGSLLKQSKLALSGFHFTQEGVHALAHRINPLAPDKIDFSIPDQSALVDHGLQVASFRAQQAFAEGLSGYGSIYEKVPVVGKWLSRFNEYLFQEYIPRLKMTMATHALERNRARYSGKLNDDQILELTANQSNAAFGELNYTMLGRNPTFQDTIRLGVLAPDFLEARGRFGLQAFTGTGAEQRVALALQAATMYVGFRLMNQFWSGDAHWDKPFSLFINNREYGLRSVVGDVWHAIKDPGQFVGNRMAPLSKAVQAFVSHRNMQGVKRTGMEQIADVMDWLTPITFDRQREKTFSDQALAASGVTVRPSTPIQKVYELLNSFKQDKSLLTKEEKEGMRSASEYAQLRTAVESGDEAWARKEYEKLLNPSDKLAAKTPLQIRRYFINYSKSPLSGSPKIEHQFVQSLSDKDKQLYLEARKEKKEIATKFLQMMPNLMKKP